MLLEHEKQVLKNLEKAYTRALADTKKRVKELNLSISELKKMSGDIDSSLIQSKVYQLKIQKALESQINSYLEVLKNDSIISIRLFLDKVYEDSFLGIVYDLQHYGIPVILPVNPDLLVKSVNRPTESFMFSERLYKNIEQLKKDTIDEISRGIAGGKSYAEIARNLADISEASFNQSYRIARTEGGRVSSDARLDSMHEARGKGADILKVWDSTLDNKTRQVHLELDGQTVEIEDNFSSSVGEVEAPHHFGIASQDINCRCVLLSIPRFDTDKSVIKKDNISGELVKTENYQEWKKGYFEVVKNHFQENL